MYLLPIKVFWWSLQCVLCTESYSVQLIFLNAFFPICIPFKSFISLMTLANILRTMLIGNGENGHCVPDLHGNALNFFLLGMMLAVRLL